MVKVLVPWTAVNVPADFGKPHDLDLWYPHRINLSIIDAGYRWVVLLVNKMIGQLNLFRSEQYTLVANGVPVGSTSDFDHDTSNEVHCGRAPKDAPKCFVRGFSRGSFILPAYSRDIRLFTSYTSRFTGHGKSNNCMELESSCHLPFPLADQSSTALFQVTSVCDD